MLLAAVVLALLVLARNLGATRSARRDPDQGPVVGSVDTWPVVPRSAAGAAPSGAGG